MSLEFKIGAIPNGGREREDEHTLKSPLIFPFSCRCELRKKYCILNNTVRVQKYEVKKPQFRFVSLQEY